MKALDRERRKLVKSWIDANPYKSGVYRNAIIEQLWAEIERWRAAYNQLCKGTPEFRNSVIEECVQVARDWLDQRSDRDLIDELRALKDKP